MAPCILPEYGYDPSCGDFQVKVAAVDTPIGKSASIRVEYNESVDSERSFYSGSLPWNGGEISVAEAEALLNGARVPFFIQSVSAAGMMLKLVDRTLKEREEARAAGPLPSILVRIWSDRETMDSEEEEDEDE